MATILYENGDFYVCAENGGFAVYEDCDTHKHRCALIQESGVPAFKRAIDEADKRENAA